MASRYVDGRLLLVGLAFIVLSGCTAAAPFRVMSFNVRGTADDGAKGGWEQRCERVVAAIRARDPDVLAIQEAFYPQVDQLRQALPEYGCVGVGSLDGVRAGEFVPVFYRKSRFSLADHGHFWLSETPSRPGSAGWDAATPRVVTWATLRFNDLPWRSVRIVNVHLDPKGERARVESAKLLRKMVESVGGQPLLLVGDFNCPPGSPPYRTLTEQKRNLSALRDAHGLASSLPICAAYPLDGGTYHGFGGQTCGGRSDWILFNRQFDALNADIARERVDGSYPSDHFPVLAEFKLRARSGYT